MMTLAEKIAEQLGISSTSVMVVNDGEEIYINGKLWDLKDWHEPAYLKRIEADVELLDPLNPNLTQEVSDLIHQLYNYLRAQRLPEHSENGTKYIYINVVQPQHQSFADSIDGLAITDRPKPEDYD